MPFMPESLIEHIDRLRKLTDGAMGAVEREHRPDQQQRARQWWDGYRQALSDMEHFVREHEGRPRASGASSGEIG
jgi:hypothetical protein